MMARHDPPPHTRGVVLAVLAAIAFGLATPLVARFGEGVGAFTIVRLELIEPRHRVERLPARGAVFVRNGPPPRSAHIFDVTFDLGSRSSLMPASSLKDSMHRCAAPQLPEEA